MFQTTRTMKGKKSARMENKTNEVEDFPGGLVVKNPPASAGDVGSVPGLGRFYMLQSN